MLKFLEKFYRLGKLDTYQTSYSITINQLFNLPLKPMKINTSKTIAVSLGLLSVQALCAQNEYGQDTGYRLQGAGANQNTDCRLQVADKGNIASLLRNDTIPISNLPSSISYLGMTPKLMMDPAELQPLEEGVERLRGAFGLSGESSSSFQSAVNTVAAPHPFVESSSSSSSSAAMSENKKRAYEEGSANMSNDEGNFKNQSSQSAEIVKTSFCFEQKILAITNQIEEAKQSSKEKRGGEKAYLWDFIAMKLEQSRDSWNKISELINKGKREKALLWRKAVEKSEDSAEGIRQAVQAYMSGNEKKAQQLEEEHWRGYYLSDSSIWELKSKEALEHADQMQGQDRDLWKSLAAQYEVAADYEREAYAAYMLGKWELACTGRAAYWSADYQAKAIKAQEAGKKELAAGYREAASTCQRAADQWKKSALAVATGKNDKAIGYQHEGKFLQAQADYQGKASEAQETGKIEIAASYREAATICQRVVDQWEQSVLAVDAGKENEAISYQEEGKSLQAMADYQVKASEAQEAGKTEFAAGYREAAATSQRAADQWRLSAQTKGEGKLGESINWGNMGKSLQTVADYQVKASEAQEAGKVELVRGYQEVVAILQRAADQWKQSALAFASEKESEGNSLGGGGYSLQMKADYQAKAIEAQEIGKTELAAGYREAASIAHSAEAWHKQAAEAKAAGKECEGDRWGWAGKSLQERADYQVKAIKAQDADKVNLQAGYREVAATCQRAADQWEKSALALAAGKECESDCWGWAGNYLQASTHSQANAFEAQEVGKNWTVPKHRELAAKPQRAADQWEQLALALASGQNSEAISCKEDGKPLQEKMDYQIKAIEAQQAEKDQLAAGYREAVAILNIAELCCQQAAFSRASIEGECFFVGKKPSALWNLAARSLEFKANYWVKACEAEEAGKTMLAAGYREAAEISQESADQMRRSAEYRGVKDHGDGILGWKYTACQAVANYKVKEIEAQEAGDIRHVKQYRAAWQSLIKHG